MHGWVGGWVDGCIYITCADFFLARAGGASSAVVRDGKRALRESASAPTVEAAYELARREMVAGARTEDAREGIRAFLEKRAPVWPGE